MELRSVMTMSVLLATASGTAGAQNQDLSDERAKLHNQRIAAEAERRAEEEERREALQAESSPPADSDVAAETSAPAAAGRADMYRVLEQLRELGELKDAGYLTEDEFSALKQKILDSAP